MPSQTARNLALGSPDDIFAYGQGISPEATWRNLIPAAEFGLGMAPGSGEAMSLYDAWKSSGQGGDALLRGDYGQAASNYGDLATALVGAIPGAGIVARGTKRGAAWMDRNLPEGFNRLLDSVYPDDPRSTTTIFAGPTAKTADQQALAQAQEMASSGASRDDIWRDTGWMQGVDGKWKFEIDDSAAQLSGVTPDKAGMFQTSKSGKFTGLDHPEYSAAYGDVPDMYGSYGPDLEPKGAYWHDEKWPYMLVEGTDPNDARSIGLHELQHNVQGREGFAPGGSPMQFPSRETLQEALERARKNPDGYDPVTGDFDFVIENNLRAAADPHDAYRRLAGETEARNVQRRRKFSAEDRRATPPWETQDVPDDQQIVRFR
jgi:hypothetical protein